MSLKTNHLHSQSLTDRIRRVERFPEEVLSESETHVVGLGLGLFAAAAVSCAPSAAAVSHLGVQAVVLAFRLGCYVASYASQICLPEEAQASWTYLFSGLELQQAESGLAEFHSGQVRSAFSNGQRLFLLLCTVLTSCRKNTAPASQAYISASTASDVEISGPPTTLAKVIQQCLFGTSPVALPACGPYHAAHLHSHADLDAILRFHEVPFPDTLLSNRSRRQILSGNGAWLPQQGAQSLYLTVAHQCLNVPTHWQATVDRCVEVAASIRGSDCYITPCGPTPAAKILAESLTARTDLNVILKTSPAITPQSLASGIGNNGRSGRCKLAIVGMSGRFPDAASHEALWDLLGKGLDVHRVVPKDRFPVETHVDVTGKAINTSHTPYGCFIQDPGLFDPRFFNMSPREALQTDPMQRLAITTAYEALEMSGYMPNRTSSTRLDRIGTFYGQTSDDWREINAAQEIDTYFITGGVRAFGPGRINYCFGFSGPSFCIDTACSSSAAALQVACTSLWAKECDTAVVGGLSVLINPDIFCGLSRGQFLSKKGPCATFDNGADGYCRGDGCASVIVKRLDDAVADKDNVLAVILGTATNHSADAMSITHPHGPTQSALSAAILDEAGVDPLDVDYVEMHGTGTQAGDGAEMVSVTNVFAPADRRRPLDRPLYIGSVKANVGHGEAASGVTALCKVLLMLQKNTIPPHVGIKQGSHMNATFPKDLSDRNVNIAFQTTSFRRKDGRPRRVFINNFSAAGGNTGLLLEDGPASKSDGADPRSHHVITITAKSKSAMVRNAKRLVEWMALHPETPIAHLAYTTTARRIQHYWRMNVTAPTLSAASVAIAERLEGKFVPIRTSDLPNKIFLFTCQGSQYAGMGKTLYKYHSVFRNAIHELDSLGRTHGFPSFLPLIADEAADMQEISPVVVQLGICCLEMALTTLLASWGLLPDVVLGHSLGEYAALHAAGVLSASDTVFLVGKRAQLLVSKCTVGSHAMLAVQGSASSVEEFLRGQDINVACFNGPCETVLSGSSEDLMRSEERLGSAGFKCTQLRVPYAFHSEQVNPILDEFERIASSVTFKPANIPVISSVLGELVEGEAFGPRYLRNHAREPVNFLGALVAAKSRDVVTDKSVWIEVGPEPVCTGLVKAWFGSPVVTAPILKRNEDSYKLLSSSLGTLHTAGLDIDWNEFHRDFSDSTRLLDIPAYSFDEKNYWIQYEGDWCLTKNRGVAAVTEPSEPLKQKPCTTSVHKVAREDVDADTVLVETETNLSRADLRPVVTGHVCNGTPLCPSTLYADIAMTVCDYAYKLMRPDAEVGLNVSSVEVPKTLIFDEKRDAHVLRCTVRAHVTNGFADVLFHTGNGTERTEHASCKVIFGDIDEWKVEFDKVNYLIKSRIDHLVISEKNGTASKIGRGLAYKLFSALVDYDPKYQGMEEVILDSSTCEATAKVRFQTTEKDGDFFFNPYWIDSCCHISGFIINGTDAVDSREQVFISHGWGSLRFVEKLDASKTYRSYIRMQPVKGTKMMTGDAFVFEGDRIIGMAGDVKFQSIPRKVLNLVLPPKGLTAATKLGNKARPKTHSPSPRPAPAPTTADDPQEEEKKQVTAANITGVNAKLLQSLVVPFLDMLTHEIGCNADELADNISFSDLGCDSLMALTVSGRMREELGVDIHSHAFLEHPTVGAFKAFLSQHEKSTAVDMRHEESGTSSGFDSETWGFESDRSVTTPGPEPKEPWLRGGDASARGLRETVRSTIAAEMGVEVDEVVAAPDLAALGMDSLMSLTILGLLRETTGLELPSDLLIHHTTLAAVEKAVGIDNGPKPGKSEKPDLPMRSFKPTQKPSHPRHINTHAGNTTARTEKPPRPEQLVDDYPHRKATSVLLQGSPRTASRHLFMIPDGSGCATSYTEIGTISQDWAVWGMLSPFMKTPEEFQCGVYGVASKFIEEIRRRQRAGPYRLAGWSAGGVIAFEIAHQLIQAGEQVEHLVLLDAPCPVIIEPLPAGLHAWFASIGLLGEGDEPGRKKMPSWLLPHFGASITALSTYRAVPIPADRCPRVTAIWCEDGVCKGPEDPRPDPYPTGHALFLLDNRVDFGPNRWDEYLDLDKIQTRHVAGNHFSMMRGDLVRRAGRGSACRFDKEPWLTRRKQAKQVGSYIREALAS